MKISKKALFLVLAITIGMTFSGCESSEMGGEKSSLEKPVRVKSVMTETFDDYMTYIASINSQKTLKLGFKSSGKLSELNVKVGDEIEIGTSLAVLEPIDVDFALEAARSQFDSAKSQVKKAKDTMDYMQKTYNDLKKLYESGSISEQELNQSKLQFDVSISDYNLALSSQAQAQTSLNQKLDVKGELNLKSPVKGTVIDIINEAGEIIGAGQAVVIIRNNNQTALVGVNQQDLSKIDLDTKVQIDIGEDVQEGTILRISEIPDPTTRTYEVEIMLEKSDAPLGAIGEVKFMIGKFSAIKLPVSSILSSNDDYVYVVEDGVVAKSIIYVENVHEGSALISGLKDGDKVVIEGMKNLKNFDNVKVLD